MVRLKTQTARLTSTEADVIAYFLFEDRSAYKQQIRMLANEFPSIAHGLPSRAFSGRDGETLVLHPKELKRSQLLLVGLGKKERVTMEQLRRGSARAAKIAQAMKASTVAIFEPDPEVLQALSDRESRPEVGTALGEGAILSLYKYDKYFKAKESKQKRLKEVRIVSSDRSRANALATGVRYADIVCEGTILARDLANAPGNEIFPESLARRVREVGRKSRIRVSVFDQKKIKRLKMGGLLGVAQGSAKPPRFIIMEYGARQKNAPTVVLVGKGVTFDSGGISIKPSANMAEMKMDMSGAAAVIGTMQVAAKLKLPFHLIGLVPATENLPVAPH
jgi:leucyl aminopeptidase